MTTRVTITHEDRDNDKPLIVQCVQQFNGYEISSTIVSPGESAEVYVHSDQAVVIQEHPGDG